MREAKGRRKITNEPTVWRGEQKGGDTVFITEANLAMEGVNSGGQNQ